MQIYNCRNNIFKKENNNVQICLAWQGQKDLNPRHAVLEAMSRTQKPHRYADFKQKSEHQQPQETVIDALLMLLVIL